ncbi:hypothetical protein [Hymenobacter volaticus]|uniref:Uncharacterized protein n=1 Tax=Hymenobacter volaticus TaxID=2932254 RepID=A0ABY4GFA3_9BACT|nr:hypothetical protein [Hymenobacter volaticus]UOQ69569.1 hypothetical protein MUN86_28430 [Hymenobacter volaticus]
MATPSKPTQELTMKRRLLLFIPVPTFICCTLLFYLGGGGKGVAEATAASSPGTAGINTSLPAASKSALFENKLDAYKAPTTARNATTASPLRRSEKLAR